MRIVAGAAKGRRLTVPSVGVRPTPDRVREALFSSLAGIMVDATVLDLFAGSGALGLEALSRGAAHVSFVEHDPKTAETLRANIDAVGINGATVHVQPAQRFLLSAVKARFDLALLDAPYAMATDEINRYLVSLNAHLTPTATVVVERDRYQDAPSFGGDFGELAVKRYGNVLLYRARRTLDASVSMQESTGETT